MARIRWRRGASDRAQRSQTSARGSACLKLAGCAEGLHVASWLSRGMREDGARKGCGLAGETEEWTQLSQPQGRQDPGGGGEPRPAGRWWPELGRDGLGSGGAHPPLREGPGWETPPISAPPPPLQAPPPLLISPCSLSGARH